MSRSSQSDHPNPEQIDSYEDRLDMLFDELAFAIRSDRPSILLVPYGSEYIRIDVLRALEMRLAEIGQHVIQLTTDAKQFDLPLILSRRTDRRHSVYSITGLSLGGGKEGANAYRALNIRRELFVDYQVRVLFWLTRDETIELSHHAPDFWAFRHRVIEFNRPADLERLAISPDGISAGALDLSGDPQEIDRQIDKNTALLAGLPHNDPSVEMLLDLLYKLATLYQEKMDYALSIKPLKQGLKLAGPLAQSVRMARYLERLGLAYQALDRPLGATRAVRKAIRFIPEDASLWISLGKISLAQGRAEAARNAFKKAIKYSPENPFAWTGLGQVYRLQAHLESSLDAYRNASQLAPQDAAVWLQLGELYIDLGLTSEAREACDHAIRLAPLNASGWANLGLVYRLGKRFSDAIIACQKALKIEPQNPSANLTLIACYRLMDQDDLAGAQIELARPVIENENEYNQGVFASVCGNADMAVELLAVALKKRLVGLTRLERDPNLDFIREDPRFQQLLKTFNPGGDFLQN